MIFSKILADISKVDNLVQNPFGDHYKSLLYKELAGLSNKGQTVFQGVEYIANSRECTSILLKPTNTYKGRHNHKKIF